MSSTTFWYITRASGIVADRGRERSVHSDVARQVGRMAEQAV